MGWWPFRRGASGRHALGAAVTSLPSGPLVLPVTLVPTVDPELPASERLAQLLDAMGEDRPSRLVVPVAPEQPDTDGLAWLTEALAWQDPRELEGPAEDVGLGAVRSVEAAPVVYDRHVGEAAVLPVVDVPLVGRVVPDAPPPVEHDTARSSEPAPGLAAAAEPAPEDRALPVVVVPVQSPPPFVPSGPPLLEPALLEPALLEPALLEPALLSAGAVQLGFRDGSTASLDPEQARALQDLARSLTSPSGG